MKTFIIYWLTGDSTEIKGYTFADACNRNGIGNGAIKAIDWYKEVK